MNKHREEIVMKVVNTKNAPGAIGPYAQAQITGNLVYTSGQLPVHPGQSLFMVHKAVLRAR